VPNSHVVEENRIGRLKEGAEVMLAVADFHGEQEGDLRFTKGTLLLSSKRVDEHWCEGRTLDGASGAFPVSYCASLDPGRYVEGGKSRRGRVQKFAAVVHSMAAQLPEEVDLVEGQIVKIVEVIDKDWYRGEVNGRVGIFPSSFVRVIDSFPGDNPPPDADLKSYLDAPARKPEEYANTRQAFQGLEEGLREVGRQAHFQNAVEGLPREIAERENRRMDSSVPREIFEDDYFRRNLPASYGSVSVDAGDGGPCEYDAEESIFSGETERCSRGFRDLSEGLAGLHRRQQSQKYEESLAYSVQPVAGAAAIDPWKAPAEASGLTPKTDYTKLAENLSILKQLSEDEPFSLPRDATGGGHLSSDESNSVFTNQKLDSRHQQRQPQSLDYNRLSENLSVFKTKPVDDASPFDRFRQTSSDDKKPKLDYTKLSENLSVFKPQQDSLLALERDGGARAESITRKNGSTFAYQTVTCEGVGYTGESVDIRPYAVALFNFSAEFDNELSLNAGEMVYLRRYVDNEWMEGEIDAERRGIFPISYVDVIVDCNRADSQAVMAKANPATATSVAETTEELMVRSTAVTVNANLDVDGYHRVLYNFRAQEEGDVTVAEGEVVVIKELKVSKSSPTNAISMMTTF